MGKRGRLAGLVLLAMTITGCQREPVQSWYEIVTGPLPQQVSGEELPEQADEGKGALSDLYHRQPSKARELVEAIFAETAAALQAEAERTEMLAELAVQKGDYLLLAAAGAQNGQGMLEHAQARWQWLEEEHDLGQQMEVMRDIQRLPERSKRMAEFLQRAEREIQGDSGTKLQAQLQPLLLEKMTALRAQSRTGKYGTDELSRSVKRFVEGRLLLMQAFEQLEAGQTAHAWVLYAEAKASLDAAALTAFPAEQTRDLTKVREAALTSAEETRALVTALQAEEFGSMLYPVTQINLALAKLQEADAYLVELVEMKHRRIYDFSEYAFDLYVDSYRTSASLKELLTFEKESQFSTRIGHHREG